jgi:hypothetical protein
MMETQAESEVTIARELISLGQQREMDLAPMYNSGTFLHDARIIWFWRMDGVIQYSLQGRVNVLPKRYKASAGAFRGMWDEAGTVADLEEAFAFLKAWLIDRKEVDDLPHRYVRREGIG